MPPEAPLRRPTKYDSKLDILSIGVLIMAVVLRREPPVEMMFAARHAIVADGSSVPIPELDRRADDFNSIAEGHHLKRVLGGEMSPE